MSAWTKLRNDLIPLMWFKHGGNRDDWMRRLAMAAAIGTGAGAAGYGPMAGIMGGASAGAATGNPALAGTSSIGPVANGMEYASLMNGMNPTMAQAVGMGDKFLTGMGKGGEALGKMNSVMGLMNGGQQQPMAPPPMQQAPMQTGRLPTGYDSMMTEEEKRRRMMMGG